MAHVPLFRKGSPRELQGGERWEDPKATSKMSIHSHLFP